ncbi:MAG: hypothetical protein JO322_14150 [Candidatus Eremiobacteraeota bacterium]|nr:hypothetical protein [Candidatus Eremiobacteraeota bacterium]
MQCLRRSVEARHPRRRLVIEHVSEDADAAARERMHMDAFIDTLVRAAHAFGAGLTLRAAGETIHDTMEWTRTLPRDRERRAGMRVEREAQLLRI